MIEVVLVVAAALAAAALVAAPIRQGRVDIVEEDNDVADAAADKRTKLGALVELEEERYTGKLSQADFALLQRQYEAEAVAALKRLDTLQETSTSDEELEAEIARAKSEMQCPKCGALRRSEGPCPECGA
jgi:rubrerythrin